MDAQMKGYRGIVRDGTVVLEEASELPEGTVVVVTPLEAVRGSPQAVLAALEASPHLSPQDVEELRQKISEGRRSVRYESPL